jgi:hypothetical protein
MILSYITAYDRNWVPHKIIIAKANGGYRVEVDGRFYSNHDSRREADDEVDDILASGKYITHDIC